MKIKGLLFSGIVLTLIGAGICVFATTRDDFDIKDTYLDPTIEEKQVTFSQIDKITYEGDADYVIFKKSEDETSSVTYYEGKHLAYSVEYNEETKEFTIRQDYSTVFLNLGFLSKGQKPVVFSLATDLDTLNFDLAAGKLTIEDLKVQHAKLDVNAGDIEIKSANIDVLHADINAGDFRFSGNILTSAAIEIDAGYIQMDLDSPNQFYTINGSGTGDISITYTIHVGSSKFNFKEE